MDAFRALFGVEAGSVKKSCLLLPLIDRRIVRGLGIGAFSRGALYGAAEANDFTVIRTGVGSALLGDAVLRLEETPCRDVFLFGSGGSAGGPGAPPVGALGCPFHCAETGSFSRMLTEPREEWRVFYADRDLHRDFMALAEGRGVRESRALTVGSLTLEERCISAIRERGVEVIDMECASLFAAARSIHRRPLALLYVTDIVGEKPFYAPRERADTKAIASAIETGLGILCEFIGKRTGG